MLVMAAAGVGLWSTPAAAAACAPGQGVSVVLDHKDVPGGSGKGVVVDCVRDGAGRSARAVFKSAGVSMRDTTRFPGLACLVDGLPSPNPACVMAPPANAFWGLYWSNGRDGKWIFSSIGVDGLNVPDGGSVAWAWQGGAKSPPAFTPPKLAPGGGDDTNPGAGGGGPVAKPQKPGKPKPTRTAPGLTTTAATPTATPTVTPTSATPTPSPSVSQTSTAAIAPSDSAEAESAPVVKSDLEGPSQESSGLPVWIPVSVLLVLAAATGVALYFRRRQT